MTGEKLMVSKTQLVSKLSSSTEIKVPFLFCDSEHLGAQTWEPHFSRVIYKMELIEEDNWGGGVAETYII